MSNKEAIRKLLSLLTGYKKQIAFIMFFMVLSTGLNMCMPLFSRSIMDDGFIGGNQPLLILLSVSSAAIFIVNTLIKVFNEKYRIDISAKIEFSLLEQAFLHLTRMKADYFSRTNNAEIMNIIYTDIGNITMISDRVMFYIVSQIFSITGGVIGLLLIDYRLTILVLLFVPFKYIVMKYFAKLHKKIMDEYINDAQEYAGWFGDTVGGISEIKLFNIAKHKYKEFCEKQNVVIDKKKKMEWIGEWNNSTDSILIQILTTILYIVGANLVFSLEVSIGSIFAFITYSSYVTAPISSILNIGYMFSGVIPSTIRYYEFMDIEEEDLDHKKDAIPVFGDLALKDISFSYEPEKPVLEHLNINFSAKSKTALIGKNGSGKSTILGLITRMYQPDQGNVSLDGQDIAGFSLVDYRNLIAVVSQQVYLFNDSIRNNICLYKNIDDKELDQVLVDSSLKEFVDEVTLDYMVGNDGTLLSGGQKQKIALARALLHNKPIVIFDEATSNADVYSEERILGLLHTKLKDKTVIIISHKKVILSVVDQIVFLNEGTSTTGSYDSLYTVLNEAGITI